MDVVTNPATTNATASAASVPKTTSDNEITSDFDMFLQLLTAQLENQDPLDPMDSEELAVQLATFSNVEQAARTNELLEQMLVGMTGDEFTAMSGWIGRDVRAPMPVAYDGEAVAIDPQPPVAGSRHELVVRDETGIEVDRRQIDSTGEPLVWAGTRTDGTPAGSGIYSFDIESFENGSLVASETAPAYARVAEIRYGATGPKLAFAGGIEVDASTVSAVREPRVN